jgi:hypothetical protein
VKFQFMPVIGSYPGMPTQRACEVRLAEAWPPQSVTVNGKPAKWTYSGDDTGVTIRTERSPVTQKVEIVITTSPELAKQEALLSGLRGRIARLKYAMALSERTWPNGWMPDALLDALQTGNRISLNPPSALEQVQKLHAAGPEIMRQLQTLLSSLDSGPAKSDDLAGVGTTMQQQREAVKRALAHIAE